MKKKRQGRIGEGVANLFSSLLWSARDGSTYFVDQRAKNGMRILRNASSAKGTSGGTGKARAVMFPYEVFENHTLFFLKHMPNDEVKALIDELDTAGDKEDVRKRLRDTLWNCLASVHLLVVPRDRDRVCAVHLRFKEYQSCNYLILYRHALGGLAVKRTPKPAQSAAVVLDSLVNRNYDLRKREDADELERTLLTLPPCLITQSIEDVKDEFFQRSNGGWTVNEFMAWWARVNGVLGERRPPDPIPFFIELVKEVKHAELLDFPLSRLLIHAKPRTPPR